MGQLVAHVAASHTSDDGHWLVKLLRHGDIDAKRAILSCVNCFVQKGTTEVVAELCACLHNEDCSVRYLAVKALIDVASRGDLHVIGSIVARLEDDHIKVRRAALQ